MISDNDKNYDLPRQVRATIITKGEFQDLLEQKPTLALRWTHEKVLVFGDSIYFSAWSEIFGLHAV